jgi:hypothetical protein
MTVPLRPIQVWAPRRQARFLAPHKSSSVLRLHHPTGGPCLLSLAFPTTQMRTNIIKLHLHLRLRHLQKCIVLSLPPLLFMSPMRPVKEEGCVSGDVPVRITLYFSVTPSRITTAQPHRRHFLHRSPNNRREWGSTYAYLIPLCHIPYFFVRIIPYRDSGARTYAVAP